MAQVTDIESLPPEERRASVAMIAALQILEKIVVDATYCGNDRSRRKMHVRREDVERAREILRELVHARA